MMKLHYKYRGVENNLSSSFRKAEIDSKLNIVFKGNTKGWSGDSVSKEYFITIEPHELLDTAFACIAAINSIAKTKYKIINSN